MNLKFIYFFTLGEATVSLYNYSKSFFDGSMLQILANPWNTAAQEGNKFSLLHVIIRVIIILTNHIISSGKIVPVHSMRVHSMSEGISALDAAE